MELFNGRPENTTERLPREVRTYDFLDNLGIDYLRTDHEPANNMEACNEIDAVLGVLICKNLFLCNRQKTRFYLLINHCEPCPVGIDIGAVNKFYDLAKIGDDMAKEHYLALEKNASDCISCGHCNSRCPFSVDQMNRMQEIKEFFA